MPVRISNDQTDPSLGKINKADMDESLRKFKEEIAITTLKGDYTTIKTTSIFFGKEMLVELLGIDPGDLDPNNIKGISIQFGVQPPGSISCEGEDYSYHLSTLVFATDTDDNLLNNIGDKILIPGYKASLPGTQGVFCCGSMNGVNTR